METWPSNSTDGRRESKLETEKKFEDTVALGKPLSLEEAVRSIAEFHGTSEEAVRAAFLNLRNAGANDTVVFDNSVSNGRHCLKIETRDAAGTPKVFSLIDADTGQPIAHIS